MSVKTIVTTNRDPDEAVAVAVLGEYPSTLYLHNIIVPYHFLKRLLENGKIVKKRFSNIGHAYETVYDKHELIYDHLAVAVDASTCAMDRKSEKYDTVLLLECTDFMSGKKDAQMHSCVTICYKSSVTADALKKLQAWLFKDCKIVKLVDDHSYINLVVRNGPELALKKFNIVDPKINRALAYGGDFADVDRDIMRKLKKSDKGIWVFHGPPGTGKSMYIRSLVKKLNKMKDVDRVIYMPSEMVGSLESPEFIPFISEHPNSVLIIEDADVALTSRKQNGSIVKTILQLTDGILADCLRLKIIATFNCDLKQIDGALLRKGRLQYRHEFRHLSRPEALALAESCKIPLTEFDKPEFADKKDWTLAEIYNIREDFHWDNNSNVVKKIGFNTHKAEPKYGIQPPQE